MPKRKRRGWVYKRKYKKRKKFKGYYWVYIIHNKFIKNGKEVEFNYIGKSKNPYKRLRRHNNGSGAFYTKMNKGSGIWEIFKTFGPFTETKSLQIEYKGKHKKLKKRVGESNLERNARTLAFHSEVASTAAAGTPKK